MKNEMKSKGKVLAAMLLIGLMVGGMVWVAPAKAGSEYDPEVTDEEGDASTPTGLGNEYFDILSVWFVTAGKTTMIINIKIADLTSLGLEANTMAGGDGSVYYATWYYKDKLYFAGLGVTATGEITYPYGYYDDSLGMYTIVGYGEGTYTDGAPGIITGKYPTQGGLKTGGKITDTGGVTFVYHGVPQEAPVWIGFLSECDSAGPGKEFTLGEVTPVTNPLVELNADIQYKEGKAGESIGFIVKAKNTGDKPATVTLIAEIDKEWLVSPSEQQITIAANATEEITFTVTIPDNASEGTQALITISGAKEPLTLTLKVVKEEKPEKPRGFIPGFELFFLIGAIGIAAFLLRRR